MAAQTREATIRGVKVKQVKFGDNWYTTVDGRIRVAEQADPKDVRQNGAGYHVVSVQIIPMGDRFAYHCMVEYPIGSGIVKPGTDFVDMKDPTGLAKAETSAIGRALGLHGILDENEGIASSEEMARVARPEAATEEKDAPRITPEQINTIRNYCSTHKKTIPPTLSQWTYQHAAEAIAKMQGAKGAANA